MNIAPPLRLVLSAAALLTLSACNLSGLQMSVGDGGPSYGSYGSYGYGTPSYGTPGYGYGYGTPRDGYGYGGYGYGAPVYRGVPRHYDGFPGRGYSRWDSPYGRQAYARNPFARNGRCDDPRYETSNGGRARPGTDEWDCSRYGQGLK